MHSRSTTNRSGNFHHHSELPIRETFTDIPDLGLDEHRAKLQILPFSPENLIGSISFSASVHSSLSERPLVERWHETNSKLSSHFPT